MTSNVSALPVAPPGGHDTIEENADKAMVAGLRYEMLVEVLGGIGARLVEAPTPEEAASEAVAGIRRLQDLVAEFQDDDVVCRTAEAAARVGVLCG